MGSKTITEIWQKALKILEGELSPVTVATWFEDATAVDMRDGQFILHTPSPFKKDIIKERLSDALSSAISAISGENILSIKVLTGDDELRSFILPEGGIRETLGYTFDNFIVGSSNRFAHAAAYAVATMKDAGYNPLFIYGPSGLGKTHLLYAIANEIRKNNPKSRIVYIKGDEFTNELITAIGSGMASIDEFRNKYRMADLLLVDDTQFIAGKERTQEEFFHTFNTLHESGKQIVLTSDRPPKEISTLEDRLKSRFEWGLLADIQPPDYETRVAIIVAKASALGFPIPEEVTHFIAASITLNVRQLEGVVKKILAMHDLMGNEVDKKLAAAAIKDIFKENPGLRPNAEYIISEAEKFFSLPHGRILSQNRSKETVFPRQIAMYLVRDMTSLSLPDIGRVFERDHTTVLHSINKIEDSLKGDESLQNTIKDIKKTIRGQN